MRNPDGKVYVKDYTNVSREEKIIDAKKYSEGNEKLEELLLLLWENGINTVSCCAGHERDKMSKNNPFISIMIDNISEDVLKKVLLDGCLNKEIETIEINQMRWNLSKNSFCKRLIFHLNDYTCKFDSILESFKKALNNEESLEELNKKTDKITDQDYNFILESIKCKQVDITNLNIADFKKYYKLLPDILESISIWKTGDKIYYDIMPNSTTVGVICPDHNVRRVCSAAYTKIGDEYIIWDENESKVIEISKEDIEKRGLISIDEYDQMIDELFGSREFFLKLIDSEMKKEQPKR